MVTHYIPGTTFESPRLITYGPYKFNIRLKNQFFVSRFSLGAGWNTYNPNYDVNRAGGHLFGKRMIGALNIDNDEQDDDSKNYLSINFRRPLTLAGVSSQRLSMIVVYGAIYDTLLKLHQCGYTWVF